MLRSLPRRTGVAIVLLLLGYDNVATTMWNVAGSTSDAALAQGVDPRQFVLMISDLPPDYILNESGSGYRTSAGTPENLEGVHDISQFGLLAMYTAQFDRADLAYAEPTGLLVIRSSAAVFDTVDGARQWFDVRAPAGFEGFAPVPVPSLGDQSYAYAGSVQGVLADGAPAAFVGDIVIVRKGRVMARMTTASADAPESSLGQTWEWARLVVDRVP
jgi:hypothetical protein